MLNECKEGNNLFFHVYLEFQSDHDITSSQLKKYLPKKRIRQKKLTNNTDTKHLAICKTK